jgi:hypothetical protein
MQALLGGPRAGLDPDDVAGALAFDHGIQSRFRVTVLDADDAETGETVPVDLRRGGQVRWSYRVPDRVGGAAESAAAVRRTATLHLTGPVSLNLYARRFRVTAELRAPSGLWVPFDLGVFVSTAPPLEDDGVLVTRSLELADKTYRFNTRSLPETVVVTAGTVPTTWVAASLLAVFGEARAGFPGSTTTLAEDMVFDADSTYGEMYNAVLQAAGFDQLIADETGWVTAVPASELASRGPEHTYQPGTTMVTAGRLEPLLPDLPNVVRFVARQGPTLPEEGNGWATRYNHSTGPGSIDERGEEVWRVVEVDVDTGRQPELEAVADADAQRYFAGGGLRYQGHVGLNPRHSDRDVVSLVKPRLDVEGGDWIVTDWAYPLAEVTSPSAVLMPVTMERRVEVTDA